MLVVAELLLFRRVHHGGERLGVDVAEVVFRKHEVVAGVDIAVELHHARVTTLPGQGAYPRLLADPVGQGGVEQLDKQFTHVLLDPLVEDGAKELTPFPGGDSEGS